jgi:DNA-binding transcriptional MerR regulator
MRAEGRPLPRSEELRSGRPRRAKATERGYRMKDLCELTGLERQTIHFYIHEGLLPLGRKTGRNMAYYGEEHLSRLRLIRRLQEERFLPLRAIKAILGGRPTGFSSAQRKLISEVKLRLLASEPLTDRSSQQVLIKDLANESNLTVKDVEELVSLGLLHATGEGAKRAVSRQDAWIVSSWGQLARAGLNRERGFSPADLVLFDQALSELFAKERDLLLERLANERAEEVAAIIQRALPILAEFLGRLHTQKARDLFALEPIASQEEPTEG